MPEQSPLELPERADRLRAVFERSRNAMLIANDSRRYTDVNAAACRLLGAPRAWILKRRVDDFTPHEYRGEVARLWASFIAEGTQAGEYELLLADGSRRRVEYSATANILPGQHLSIFVPLVSGQAEIEDARRGGRGTLTPREAEVMGLLALGASTQEVAETLTISRETARTHAKNAIHKLGARNRAHAVAVALTRGDVQLT